MIYESKVRKIRSHINCVDCCYWSYGTLTTQTVVIEYWQWYTSNDRLPVIHFRETFDVRKIFTNVKRTGRRTVTWQGHTFKGDYLVYRTNDQDPETKPENLDHGSDDFNYRQTVWLRTTLKYEGLEVLVRFCTLEINRSFHNCFYN